MSQVTIKAVQAGCAVCAIVVSAFHPAMSGEVNIRVQIPTPQVHVQTPQISGHVKTPQVTIHAPRPLVRTPEHAESNVGNTTNVTVGGHNHAGANGSNPRSPKVIPNEPVQGNSAPSLAASGRNGPNASIPKVPEVAVQGNSAPNVAGSADTVTGRGSATQGVPEQPLSVGSDQPFSGPSDPRNTAGSGTLRRVRLPVPDVG